MVARSVRIPAPAIPSETQNRTEIEASILRGLANEVVVWVASFLLMIEGKTDYSRVRAGMNIVSLNIFH
jgi:hypothetical protein